MSALRELPPVDALAAQVEAPRPLALAAARAVLAERRAELLAGAADAVDLGERARAWARDVTRPSLRRVLNATGVIVHTNLGRAPLAEAAIEAVAAAARGYSNLELELSTGARGSRHAHVADLLCALTGAEAGMVVNNGAGAALLAAAALAGPGREVVVSRGQLVEIGGGFRVPDVIAQAGARLVEVGTTNRTRLADYSAALGEHTGAVLRVHQSNFRQLGFVEDVAIEALCELGVPVIDDVGSGALRRLAGRADGAAVGARGRGAGVLLGRQAARRAAGGDARRARSTRSRRLAGIRSRGRCGSTSSRWPLWRRRCGCTATRRRRSRCWRCCTRPREALAARAQRLAAAVGGAVVEGVARVGGGALPLLELPGPVVALADASLAAALRRRRPARARRASRTTASCSTPAR